MRCDDGWTHDGRQCVHPKYHEGPHRYEPRSFEEWGALTERLERIMGNYSTFRPHPRPQPDPQVEFCRLNRWVIRRFVEQQLPGLDYSQPIVPAAVVDLAVALAQEIANRCEDDDPSSERAA